MSGHLTCALKDWYKERKHRGSKNYRFDAANACSLGSSEVSAKNVIDSRTAGILLVDPMCKFKCLGIQQCQQSFLARKIKLVYIIRC